MLDNVLVATRDEIAVRLALIVDDSKTAQMMLRKMLDKLHISVATVESAEQALEYLQTSHPDVIFMDHMMPGMDGFAAVKAIKSDPSVSAIPIVMHTTKKGDIYVGQARALGAADILSKPASDEELGEVIARVRTQAVAKIAAKTTMEMAVVVVDDENDTEQNLNVGPEPQVVIQPLEEEESFFGSSRQWVVAVIWLLPILWLLNLYWASTNEVNSLRQSQLELYRGLEWSINQQASYDYGDQPMADDRLQLLSALITRLERSGFRGIIRVEGHVGEFCLSQLPLLDGSAMLMLPQPELSIATCDVIGTSSSAAMRASIAQSPAFTRYIQGLQLRDIGIRVELMPHGSRYPLYDYPVDAGGVTTGDWNAVALVNNRVNFRLIPSL
jgi:CheY-like chemotaxis protein|tara:strand:+ start:121 stop:1275 length:1155 start_codon:yes stop_codon:yes gene_type:complete